LIKLLGRRGIAAVLGIFLTTMGSAPATAQDAAALKVDTVVRSVNYDLAAQPIVNATAQAGVATAIHTVSQTFGQQSFAANAKWLHDGGWGLEALVDKFATNEQLDEEMDCLATAVFFEARGESLNGQLAVARVVINRAASGKYPSTWCATVKQPWQFSFVRKGQFPYVDKNSALWARAQSVAKIAAANIIPSLSNDVLWYHADYVSPAWGPRLVRVEKIGAHIFYR
jgi:N-acetylmuramoyl-L-alanine amidase